MFTRTFYGFYRRMNGGGNLFDVTYIGYDWYYYFFYELRFY